MRVMVNSLGTEVKVLEHLMTNNFLEYYVLECETNTENNSLCLVVNNGTAIDEMGDVNLPELAPYLLCSTSSLRDLMPAPGYKWKDTLK